MKLQSLCGDKLGRCRGEISPGKISESNLQSYDPLCNKVFQSK